MTGASFSAGPGVDSFHAEQSEYYPNVYTVRQYLSQKDLSNINFIIFIICFESAVFIQKLQSSGMPCFCIFVYVLHGRI